MGMGCSRSEHASLQGAHAIRGSARGRGPGCGRNVPLRGRAHPSCALRQQRSPLQKNSGAEAPLTAKIEARAPKDPGRNLL